MNQLTKVLKEQPLPKLFVFDLDYTLWPFWCDTHITPPLKLSKGSAVVDRYGYKIELYKDVREILQMLKDQKIFMAAASRTHAPKVAKDLLKLLDIDKYFSFKEIYPGTKLAHFAQFKKESDFCYNEMIFFDDEMRNIHELSAVGVVSQFVNDGLTVNDMVTGIQNYKKKFEEKVT